MVKLVDIMEKEEPNGTYVAVKFSDDSNKRLGEFCLDNNVTDPLNEEDFHSTVIYSRTHLKDFETLGEISPSWEAEPLGFEVWPTKPNAYKDEAGFCLVMKIKCPEMLRRFEKVMNNTGASYDFEEYIPHITLSYEIDEDFDISTLKWTSNPLEIVLEYTEDLILNEDLQ